MARLFIGIPLPETYHDRSTALIRDLRSLLRSKVRWTPFGNAHITLLFLGEVDEADIPGMKDSLASITLPAFHIRAGKCGAFPDKKRPRVIYAGITKGVKPCVDLARAVADAMALFVKPPDKPYSAHITLGRVKQHARDNWAEILKDMAVTWPGFKVDRFVLWRSDLTSEGAIYTPLAEFPLLED